VHRQSCRPLGSLVAVLVYAYSDATFSGSLEPTSVFTQAGSGDQHTQAYVVGATWDGPWAKHLQWANVGEYFEVEIGRWSTRVNHVTSAAWPTQAGVTPVFRVTAPGGSP
jgi:hypothetical protein